MKISPLVNLDRKGEAIQITQQQFIQVIGGLQSYVSMPNTNSDKFTISKKLWRRRLVQALHIKSATNGIQIRMAMLAGSWYKDHAPNGYATYQQIWNGFYFGMLYCVMRRETLVHSYLLFISYHICRP
jgi:hypothetical protein